MTKEYEAEKKSGSDFMKIMDLEGEIHTKITLLANLREQKNKYRDPSEILNGAP